MYTISGYLFVCNERGIIIFSWIREPYWNSARAKSLESLVWSATVEKVFLFHAGQSWEAEKTCCSICGDLWLNTTVLLGGCFYSTFVSIHKFGVREKFT